MANNTTKTKKKNRSARDLHLSKPDPRDVIPKPADLDLDEILAALPDWEVVDRFIENCRRVGGSGPAEVEEHELRGLFYDWGS